MSIGTIETINPLMPFGKHVNVRLSDLPETYLMWMVGKDISDKQGRNWTELAKQELIRRSNNDPLPQGLEVGEFNELPTLIPSLSRENKPIEDKKVIISYKAVDDAVDWLLTDYLKVAGPNLKFMSWLVELTKEVIRYGQKEESRKNTIANQHQISYDKLLYWLTEKPDIVELRSISLPVAKDVEL